MDKSLLITIAVGVLSFGLGAAANWLRARAVRKLRDADADVKAARATPDPSDDKLAEQRFQVAKIEAQRLRDVADALEKTDPGRVLRRPN